VILEYIAAYRARETWITRAACRDHPHPEWWYPRSGDTGARARAHCEVCPVRRECLERALADDYQSGIWGGMSEKERRKEKRRRREAARKQ
jgi:WhiB family redox-sensing transcriptional regulator